MFPSLRGGNDNPGRREGFLGEVDDILSATDYLASLSYVDPQQIYLGGHSTGGTMAMLMGAASDRYRAIISLGPVGIVNQYGGEYIYCNWEDTDELIPRSPLFWLDCIKTPTFVIEGAMQGNWEGIEMMKRDCNNSKIRFLKVPNKNHFDVIAPVVEKVAPQILAGQVSLTEEDATSLK